MRLLSKLVLLLMLAAPLAALTAPACADSLKRGTGWTSHHYFQKNKLSGPLAEM